MYSVLRIAFYKHISEILTKIVMEKPHYRGNLLLSNFSLGRFDIYNFPSGGEGTMEEKLLYNRAVNLLKDRHDYLCQSVGIIILHCIMYFK